MNVIIYCHDFRHVYETPKLDVQPESETSEPIILKEIRRERTAI